jgi:hypothetical protein
MNNHEALRLFILREQVNNPTGYISHWPPKLSRDFKISESQVTEVVEEMVAEGLMECERNNGHYRVKLTAKGSALQSTLPAHPIGF